MSASFWTGGVSCRGFEALGAEASAGGGEGSIEGAAAKRAETFEGSARPPPTSSVGGIDCSRRGGPRLTTLRISGRQLFVSFGVVNVSLGIGVAAREAASCGFASPSCLPLFPPSGARRAWASFATERTGLMRFNDDVSRIPIGEQLRVPPCPMLRAQWSRGTGCPGVVGASGISSTRSAVMPACLRTGGGEHVQRCLLGAPGGAL
mmetsp:Transcript_17419/g.47575  ORF Transcript_17419/g.47575 Transcript_17419/m.47575 type:complete len:206 (+) Transcript_17419:1505-2122(+)